MATSFWIDLPAASISIPNPLPVSGTVTANQGTANTPANAWPVLIENTLIKVSYDYISATYPSGTQEVYIFKTGGSGGSTVATVTVNYTDTTKNSILNVGVV